ncbi:MAG: autotransporter-associated beta strand repeat-containing protein [Kiritimatiellae bacterium]|nr:autotransporter-associated beta strand repeat-containing protein [Kiritimatiellia bacterium]
MKKSACLKRVAMVGIAALAGFAVEATPLGTNIWIGPPTGGMWTDPANWKTNAGCAYTSEFLLKTNCLYNFTALQDGAVVTNDGTTLRIEGLRFKENQGTITLYGTETSNCRMPNEQQWLAGTGTIVNVRLRQPINWLDYDTKIILNPKEGAASQNSGTWRIAPNPDFQPYRRLFEPCAYTTLYVGSPAPNFNLTYFNIWNYAQVVLDANLTVGQLHGISTTGLDLNGHDLFIGGGEVYKSNYIAFTGDVRGSGNITFAGGAQITFGQQHFTGNLRLLTGDVIYGAGVTIPETVCVKTDRSGILRVSGDQTLVNLSGDGTSGGVTIKDASTLTVAASAATTTVFNARLCGAVDLVKDGPGTFEMTGVNALTGAVRVTAGTLALKRPIYREGLVARWGFEDAANLLRDSGPNGCNLTRNASAIPSVLFQTNGIDNLRGIHFSVKDPSNAWATNYLRVTSATAARGFPCGGSPRTWSIWLRPTTKSTDTVYLLRRGNWQIGKELMLWLRARNRLRFSIHEYSDPSYTNSIDMLVSDITDGNWHHVVGTYSNRVLQLYYDGQLLQEKTTDATLDIADGSEFVIGNNDPRNVSTHNYDGDMDDVQIYNRVLSAAEVADEYARRTAVISDPATILPEPVSRWRFDDASDPGKDDKGVCHLVKNTMPNAPTGTPTINANAAAYGGGYLANGASLMPEGGVFPEAFPTGGQSLTVSCRLMPRGGTEWGGLVCWGDALTANKFFRFGIGNCPRRLHVAWSKKNSNATTPVKDCDRTFSDTSQNNCSNPTAWTHVVMVYDGKGKTMTLYRDGAYVVQSTGVSLNVAAQNFYVGWREGWGTSGMLSYIDDLQLFDVALTAAEVRTLTRALETDSVGSVLRPETPVTVDAGATLEVSGECHVVQTLTCAGALAFKDAGQLEVTGTTAVTGELLGAGTLVLDAGGNFRKADASGFTGNLVVKGGKAVLNRTFKPVAREVAAGAEIVWIEAGTQVIFR